MPSTLQTSLLALLVLSAALVYQSVHGPIYPLFGIGRAILPISHFPYSCRKLVSHELEGCEHLLFNSVGRTLYAACSSVESRRGWNPGGSKFNNSARTLKDHIVTMTPGFAGRDGLHNVQSFFFTGLPGGRNEIDVLGFNIQAVHAGQRRMYLINHRPPRDPVTGAELDGSTVGANSTIEVLDHIPGERDLIWQRTLTGEGLITPNSLVVLRQGGLLVTNDHFRKVGPLRHLELLTGGGSIAYCPPPPEISYQPAKECKLIAPPSPLFRNPNGIVQGPGPAGLIYISHSGSGLITVHELDVSSKPPKLTQVDSIATGYPLDNLSIDENGDIYAVGFPSMLKLATALFRGGGLVPGTVLRIRMIPEDGKYEVTKILEDKEGASIPHVMTVAVRDPKTKNLWLGGVLSPFITVCSEQEGKTKA